MHPGQGSAQLVLRDQLELEEDLFDALLEVESVEVETTDPSRDQLSTHFNCQLHSYVVKALSISNSESL